VNPDTIGYVWTGKFLYPERKSCRFENIRILVDGASDTKKTTPNIEFSPESLGAKLEY